MIELFLSMSMELKVIILAGLMMMFLELVKKTCYKYLKGDKNAKKGHK